MRDCVKNKKQHAMKKQIKKIELPEIQLGGEVSLEEPQEEIFGGKIDRLLYSHIQKRANTVQGGTERRKK